MVILHIGSASTVVFMPATAVFVWNFNLLFTELSFTFTTHIYVYIGAPLILRNFYCFVSFILFIDPLCAITQYASIYLKPLFHSVMVLTYSFKW